MIAGLEIVITDYWQIPSTIHGLPGVVMIEGLEIVITDYWWWRTSCTVPVTTGTGLIARNTVWFTTLLGPQPNDKDLPQSTGFPAKSWLMACWLSLLTSDKYHPNPWATLSSHDWGLGNGHYQLLMITQYCCRLRCVPVYTGAGSLSGNNIKKEVTTPGGHGLKIAIARLHYWLL